MSAESRSWSQPAEAGRRAALVVAAGCAAFLAAWGLLHVTPWRLDQIVDTPVYQHYGLDMRNGEVPYRDFTPEYPPAALPAFALPALVAQSDDGYRAWFEWEMALCGIAGVGFVALCVRALGGERRLAATTCFVALAPLALGSVFLTRFDLWPAALTAAALAALLAGRDRLGLGALGLATAAKLYPAVLLPLAVAWVWRRRGRRDALVALAVFVAVLAACFVPFLVLGPHGVLDSLHRQLRRPLQIESLGAGFLLAAHQAFGLGIRMESSSGSQNLAGTLPDVLAWVQSVLQVVALVWLWQRFARGPMEAERLARYAAAAVTAFVALGKVLSPQFLIWLVFLVPLVRRRLAWALLAAALVVTQGWFPYRYWSLVKHFDALSSWLVPVRDLILVALLAALAARRARAPAG
ncbi:MAG TPA: glycosyltransferase 87 family protein [Gaiellaceae bacterium]|nr:glycosyltransferase 87 family protein [Gaiellaceae bacterium]